MTGDAIRDLAKLLHHRSSRYHEEPSFTGTRSIHRAAGVRSIRSKAKTKRASCREEQLITPACARCAGPYIKFESPHLAKTFELSPSGLPRGGSSFRKLKDFASPFRRCSHRALPPFAFASQAPLRSSFRQCAITAVRSE
jgi:hypothetical protein